MGDYIKTLGDVAYYSLSSLVGISAVALFLFNRKMGRTVKAKQNNFVSAKGKTVIITGANTGIGKATATELAKLDARVILACRNRLKAEDAVFSIREITNKGTLVIKSLDLSSLSSIKDFADDIKSSEDKLDILINNAGLINTEYSETKDGFESTFGVNHLGHFALTLHLMKLLKKTKESRIINLSSELHKNGKINFLDLYNKSSYRGMKAYSQSKLANVLFTNHLSKLLHETSMTICSLSPGFVNSDLFRGFVEESAVKRFVKKMFGWIILSPKQGCQTVLFVALDASIAGEKGNYYRNCKKKKLSSPADDAYLAKKLWETSEKLTNIKAINYI